jgi:hypothetical protein
MPSNCENLPHATGGALRLTLQTMLSLALTGALAAGNARAATAAEPEPAMTLAPGSDEPASPAVVPAVRLLVQSSPLAGYNHHQAPRVFAALRVGDPLALVREADNPHDPNAVSVHWGAHTLGYVPRARNALIAWALDRGEPLGARVSRLQRHRSPPQRIEFEVYME